MSDWSFSAALGESKRGNRKAAAWLYERFRGQVRGHVREYVNAYLRRHYDSLDLSQSVFCEVLRNVERLEDLGEPAFRGLLRLKTRSKVREKYRKHLDRDGNQRAVPLHPGHVHPDGCPVEAASRTEARRQLAAALARLEPRARELVRLRMEEGLSYAAIAERLGYASADAARMRHARTLIRLQAPWIKS